MIKEETVEQIIENLKLLTLQNKIEWKNDRGVFYTEYLGDKYEISMLAFMIDDSIVGVVMVSKKLQEFYVFLNDLLIGQSVLEKLNKSCSDTFLKDLEN